MSPVIEPGTAGGAVTKTGRLCIAEDPQAAFAVTEIFPPVVPVMTVIELLLEFPDQPAGNIHV